MCWAIHIGGKEVRSRDELERVIGDRVIYAYDGPRHEADHCLCSIDIPCTMVAAGYWVRGWREGDPSEPGDHFARANIDEVTA